MFVTHSMYVAPCVTHGNHVGSCLLQIRLQREIDRLEKENRELRRQLLLKDQKRGPKRKMKV